MALIAVSIFVSDPAEVDAALARAVRAAEHGAQLVEWRVDNLAESEAGRAAAAELVERSALPSIITCRSAAEGGMFAGDEADRMELLTPVLEQTHRPRYVDLGHSDFARISEDERAALLALLRDQASETRLILSSHDFTDRPADLMRRVHALSAEPACDVVKIAWRARSLRDNLEAFDLLREKSKPMIALCMGEFGLMSRVLQGKFGGLVTYASDSHDAETAPGQPTIEELVHRYRFAKIGRDTKVFGVIGSQIARSLSPVIHNAGFEAIDFDGVYLPLPVPPEWEHFKATVGSLLDFKPLNFRGASVTMPHKQHLVRFVKERGGTMDSLSERCGAANTLIVRDDGALECINTDGPALVSALVEGMHIEPGALAGKRVAVLGTGGTARAAAIALVDLGATITIVSRKLARSEALVNELQCGAARAGQVETMHGERCDIIINCTPVTYASPLPVGFELSDAMTVLDINYATESPMLAAARAAGATTITGMSVFTLQAAMQFERWTGASIREEFTTEARRARSETS